jgi:restriction endonuclease S subunit
MNVKLGQIADVSTGYIKRENKKPAEPIIISIIQLRDLNVNGAIDYKNVKSEEIGSNDRYPELFPGDVIFAAKGSKRSAAVIERESKSMTVSNHYLIIRIHDDFRNNVLPGYLAFYMRQKPAMDYFDLCAAGSHMPFVSAAALKELEVEVPPVERQETLTELGELIGREAELENKLITLKRDYYENSLEQVIKAGK